MMGPAGHLAHTRAAVEALAFAPAARLRWAGMPVRMTVPPVPSMRSLLVEQISTLLYERFYCYGRVAPLASRPEAAYETMAQARFVDDLIGANRAPDWWEAGWRPVGAAGAYLAVERGGLGMLLAPDGWRQDEARPTIAARRPSGSLALSPGYYVVTAGARFANEEVLRLYWNVSPTGASRLIQAATTLLPDAAGAFQLKLLVRLSHYGRADTGVLYLPHARIEAAAEAVQAIYHAVRPHLNPGSQRCYPIAVAEAPAVPCPRATPPGDAADLELAVRIGDELVRSAIWDGQQCNWVGDLIGSPRAFGALGADFYSGTSGIAVVLAELYRATGQPAIRRTAAGAIAQACAGHRAATQRLGKGLYTGWAGIALAAWRCAALLDMPPLRQQADAAFDRLVRMAGGCVTADVMGGEAGAILALLGIGSDRSLRLATRFGTALLGAANRRGKLWSWPTANPPGCRDLTGFSHGTAGIAAPLLLLGERTGATEFHEAAAGALRYERGFYDAAERNWLDLREVRRRDQPARFALAWCHGAPGIALSRAVATRFADTAAAGAADLHVALETTRTAIRAGLTGDTGFCLCHGLAGNADILTLVGNADDRALAAEVAQLGQTRSAAGWLPFAGAECVPGLLTGIAGVAAFYLRPHDPDIPSPLWPVPMPVRPMQGRAA